jgi:DNA-directed RNA polymerase specialized sigma24 family protein
MTTRTVLQDISQQQERIEEMQAYQRSAVAQARLTGHSWTEIGKALGMSRQAAHERFRDAELPEAPVRTA